MTIEINGLRDPREATEILLQANSLEKHCSCGCDGAHWHRSGHDHQSDTTPSPLTETEADNLALIEAFIAGRSLRGKFFDGDLLFDPAWSMILDLYRSYLKNERLSVTAVCIGSGVPETTALRYLRELEERGYVERIPDENDRRRIFSKLTKPTFEALTNYFASLRADTFGAKVLKRA